MTENEEQQDRLKTAEINILVKENRELKAKVDRLAAALDAATDVGIYAASLSGAGPGKDYEKRTDYMEGWNACAKESLSAAIKLLGDEDWNPEKEKLKL